MKNRKPFELKTLIAIYNLVQVTGNMVLGCYGVYFLFWKFEYNFSCQPVDYSTTEHGMAELYATYAYFLFKLLDLFDTVS